MLFFLWLAVQQGFFYQMWLGSNVIKSVIMIHRGGHGVGSGLDRCS